MEGNMNIRGLTAIFLLAASHAAALAAQANYADTIFTNSQNTILTMVDDGTGTNIIRASALAVQGGNILAVGSPAEVLANKGPHTQIISLNGTNALLPGFVDPHSHIFTSAAFLLFDTVRPVPFSTNQTLEGVYAELRAWANATNGGFGSSKWIVGTGFDPSNFTNAPPAFGRFSFPTRLDLDAAFPDNPVVLIHYSGHIAVCNSRALTNAGMNKITNDTDILLYPTPYTNSPANAGTPNGILLESAVIQLSSALIREIPKPKLFPTFAALLSQAQRQLAAEGITTTQEGAATAEEIAVLYGANALKHFSIDVVGYLLYASAAQLEHDILALRLAHQFNTTTYTNHLRMGGFKLVLDGTPPAETAWLASPYYTYIGLQNVANTNNYVGVRDLTDDEVNSAVSYAYKNDIQVMAHVNGDAAQNQFLTAIQSAIKPSATFHPVAIHSQVTQSNQIQLMRTLGVIPSFFPDHVYYFGEQYASTVLGTNRAADICATGWAKQANLPFTLHNDTPMMPNNLLVAMWSAVNRVTYDYSAGATGATNGYVIGPSQQITVIDALKAVTTNAAYQYGEQGFKGILSKGYVADLVVLDQDPTATPASDLLNRVVLQTFKAGANIYQNPGVSGKAR